VTITDGVRAEAPPLDYASVPAAGDDAVVDPHWLDLRSGAVLPAVYLPPAMAGRRRVWTRIVAVALVAVFLGATAAGVCLTYGPPLGRI
jgi:hypothetical protein